MLKRYNLLLSWLRLDFKLVFSSLFLTYYKNNVVKLIIMPHVRECMCNDNFQPFHKKNESEKIRNSTE